MFQKFDYPVIVIGAGAAGLVIAIGLAKARKKVLLIEKGHWGGDCTNFGCIPSKSLIESAKTAHSIKSAKKFGLNFPPLTINADNALEKTRALIDEIKREEDESALKKQHVETLTANAAFLDPHTLKVEFNNGSTKKITGKKIIIATGSYPIVPKIEGLKDIPFYTNETIFDLEKIPKSLCIIGGGPIGCELGQAFQRLGSKVSIIERNHLILKKEEKHASKIIENVMKEEGICFQLNCHPTKIEKRLNEIAIFFSSSEKKECEPIIATHLLIAGGRKPSIEKLNLEKAGVTYNEKGILVDAFNRTSKTHIFALGDVTGRALFTHVAENEARAVLRNLLLPFPFKTLIDKNQAVPRVTFTDPEVASFGLNETEASLQYGKSNIAIYTVPLNKIDRARTARRTEGFIKVITKKWSSQILGGTIVAEKASEIISELTLAKKARIPLRKLTSLIHPYPTYSQAIRKAADKWLTETLLAKIIKQKFD